MTTHVGTSRIIANIVVVTVALGLLVYLVARGLTGRNRPQPSRPPVTELASAPAAQIIKAVDVNKLLKDPKKHVVVVDLQERHEYRKEHIPSAINIPSDEIEIRADDELSKTDQIILMDCACDGTNTGSLTRRAVLIQHGFQSVSILDGGLAAWKNANFPLVRDNESDVNVGKLNP